MSTTVRIRSGSSANANCVSRPSMGSTCLPSAPFRFLSALATFLYPLESVVSLNVVKTWTVNSTPASSSTVKDPVCSSQRFSTLLSHVESADPITLFYDAGQDCLSGLAACNFGLFSSCPATTQQAAIPGHCTCEPAILRSVKLNHCPKSAIITPACDPEPHGAIVVEVRDEIRREAGSIGFEVVALPDTAAKSAEAAIRFLIDHLVSTGRLQLCIAPAALNAVLDREQLGSTGVGNSVAMPQAALPNLTKDVIGVVANSATGISWKAADDVQVRWIVLCLTRSGLNADRLRALQSLLAAIRQMASN